jgi:hypothetical protein
VADEYPSLFKISSSCALLALISYALLDFGCGEAKGLFPAHDCDD